MSGLTLPNSEAGNSPPIKKDWKDVFLASLRSYGNWSRAARDAGIDRSTATKKRGTLSTFADACNDAYDEYIDGLEARADELGQSGKNDTLLMFRLKALRPEKYRETIRQEHTGRGGNAILHQHDLSPLARRILANPDAIERAEQLFLEQTAMAEQQLGSSS